VFTEVKEAHSLTQPSTPSASILVVYNPTRTREALLDAHPECPSEAARLSVDPQNVHWFDGRLAQRDASHPLHGIEEAFTKAARILVFTGPKQATHALVPGAPSCAADALPDAVLVNLLQWLAGPQYDPSRRRHPAWAHNIEIVPQENGLSKAVLEDWKTILEHLAGREEIDDEQLIDVGFGESDLPVEPAIVPRARSVFPYEKGQGRESIRGWIQSYWAYPASSAVRSSARLLLTAGSTQALSCALGSLRKSRTRIVLPRPCYPWYVLAAQRLGYEIAFYDVQVNRGSGCDLDPTLRPPLDFAALSALLRPTDVVVFNFPHNPTGAALTPEQILRAQAVTKAADAFLLSDEVYRLPGDPASFLSTDDLPSTLVVGSFSKMLGLSGARVGFALGHPDLISAIASDAFFHTLTVGMAGADLVESALPTADKRIAALQQGFARNAALLTEAIAPLGWADIACRPSPFAWLVPPKPLGDDAALASHVLSTWHLAVTRGTECASSGALRVNLSVPERRMRAVALRLAKALETFGSSEKSARHLPQI
jgi:aminotransferase